MNSTIKQKTSILVGICSAHGYECRRTAQRETWLKEIPKSIHCVFFLGNKKTSKPDEGDMTMSDIIELNIPDDYSHLPAKVKAFFQYALDHYDFEWLFKCDDDTYIALDRLGELVHREYDLIGDISLIERGAPSGGAGYFLSHSLVEKIVHYTSIPETGYEDLIYGELANNLGARTLASHRLNMNAVPYPLKQNDIVTCHWCKPELLRVIHHIYSSWPQMSIPVHHKQWGWDTLNFYQSGVFYREKSACCGFWKYSCSQEIELHWCQWGRESVYFSEDCYRNDHLSLSITHAEVQKLNQWHQENQRKKWGFQPNKMNLVQLGSGGNDLSEWINTNIEDIDITQKLPFDHNSIDAYFLEHVIEHINTAEAYRFFEEVWRTLKPGGIIRLAFPDLVRLKERSSADYLNFIKEWGWGNGLPGSDVRAIVVQHGHKAIWSKETMRIVLESLGFRVTDCEVGESEYKHLQNLERHGDQIPEIINLIETSCIEAQKR